MRVKLSTGSIEPIEVQGCTSVSVLDVSAQQQRAVLLASSPLAPPQMYVWSAADGSLAQLALFGDNDSNSAFEDVAKCTISIRQVNGFEYVLLAPPKSEKQSPIILVSLNLLCL